jgi:ureidoglycolate hydrolase
MTRQTYERSSLSGSIKRQGMIYRSGVWHHPILALGRKALFLAQSWKNETERDCEIATIAQLVIGSDLISSSVELP